jgi:hypothetical protein
MNEHRMLRVSAMIGGELLITISGGSAAYIRQYAVEEGF